MTLEELYEILDIETGSEFEYFENFADLVECEEEIEADLIYALLEEADLKVFSELVESYFYDVMENIPQDQIDIYNLMETIKRNFVGMAQAVSNEEDENALVRLADEIVKFRKWYSIDRSCSCTDPVKGTTFAETVRDAITDSRMEKIGGNELVYDFSQAADYELDEYIMTYGDMINE